MVDSKFFLKNTNKWVKKIIKSIPILTAIVIIPLSAELYKDSRRFIYAGRSIGISAVKKSSQKNTSYDMQCSLPYREWGRVIKNDPERYPTEYITEEREKLWQNLSELDTYILLDLAEKYIDEEYYVYPEIKVRAVNNDCYVVTYNKYTNYGKEKSCIKVCVDPREAGYIYQIMAFEYYLHKYYWGLIIGCIILPVTVFIIIKRKPDFKTFSKNGNEHQNI